VQQNLEGASALHEGDSPDDVVDWPCSAMFHAATAMGLAVGKRYRNIRGGSMPSEKASLTVAESHLAYSPSCANYIGRGRSR